MTQSVIIALLIPFAGTALGSAFVFFMRKEMPELLQKILLGFASGVMVAASVWSLLIPSMNMTPGNVWPATAGLLAGFAFLLLINFRAETDGKFLHLHPGQLGRDKMSEFMHKNQNS